MEATFRSRTVHVVICYLLSAFCYSERASGEFTASGAGVISTASDLREARMLLNKDVPKTMQPPAMDHWVGCSPTANMTQIGLRMGSIMLMIHASRAPTWRMARP